MNERPHGASGLRAETTNAATAMMRPNRSGLVVRLAAVAKPSAHIHQAMGCSHLGFVKSDPVMRRACVAVAKRQLSQGQ